MTKPRTVEERHLRVASDVLAEASSLGDDYEVRLQVLEAAAARVGGFDLDAYQRLQDVRPRRPREVATLARRLVDSIGDTPIPAPFALAALARPRPDELQQKKAGAWYTDWRLASHLVATLPRARSGQRILDPASGTGILLVAAVLHMAGDDREVRAQILREAICASDLDRLALRGAALSLASLTSDMSAIEALLGRLRCADALTDSDTVWRDLPHVEGARFHFIVGNPPWERLRVTRHELHAERGHKTHYGDDLPTDADRTALARAKADVASYTAKLNTLYGIQGTGDPDLFKLFTELALKLLDAGGYMAWLLPGGIIRSQGTAEIRRHLLDKTLDLRFTVLSNRARFFEVDTRQKVVLVEAVVGQGERQPIRLRHAEGTSTGVEAGPIVQLGRAALAGLREDLAIPEVRSPAEWSLYTRMARSGRRVADWAPRFVREVDMTQDKGAFLRAPAPGAVPLLEGRMVHQYTHDAKRYVSGTGRAAVWSASDDRCELRPQFWFPRRGLGRDAASRVDVSRVGFCDITGQTNERAMLAARIPAGVVCGNKVPTITFDGDQDGLAADAFVAIANSFAFDWLLRRMVTTTVNYFLLRDLPWPALDPDGLPARRLAELARRLGACRHCEHDRPLVKYSWEAAEIRADVEANVADAWGLDLDDMRLIFEDFPLLDRAWSPIRKEPRSTITRDFVLLRVAERGGASRQVVEEFRARVVEAKLAGAVPFVPSHLVLGDEAEDEVAQ